MTKNIYKEFCANNPNLKQTAKATYNKDQKDNDRRDIYACSMLAESAKEAALAYRSQSKHEKAIYYYSKASKWYARINDDRWEAMEAKIAEIAKRYTIKVSY